MIYHPWTSLTDEGLYSNIIFLYSPCITTDNNYDMQ